MNIMKRAIEKILEGVSLFDAEVFVPEHEAQGHYSTNAALRLAKGANRQPFVLARELAEKIGRAAPKGFFEKVEAAPPGFINFWITKEALAAEFTGVAQNIKNFGRSDIGRNKTVIVEYSQPNIGKMLHVGHLRTTIIGDALANLFDALGHKVIRWNYLGDWGTQFGKLIAAYKLWGDKKKVAANSIAELQALYVRFHDELNSNPELDKMGQEEFKKLEEGDQENRRLWGWFKEESLKALQKIYDVLGVKFDTWIGESFFEYKLKPLIADLFEIGVARESDGAAIVPLDKFNLPPALIRKADGASLYLTRDLANLSYRLEKYRPEKILYVVGNEQSLHFEQLFAVAKILGWDKQSELMHVKYGLVLGESGEKLATREGRTIPLNEVLEKAIRLARDIVEKKNPDLPEDKKEEIARAVGVGALKYNDLKENRTTDIVFDWGKMLSLSGESAPYLQYTYARLRNILRKSEIRNPKSENIKFLDSEIEWAIIRKIFEFPDGVARSAEILQTSGLANYLYRLAVLANRLYETTPVLKEENASRRGALLSLIEIVAEVLKSGLGFLGIETLEKI